MDNSLVHHQSSLQVQGRRTVVWSLRPSIFHRKASPEEVPQNIEVRKDKFQEQSDRLETWSELSLACRPQQNILKRIPADTAVPSLKAFIYLHARRIPPC